MAYLFNDPASFAEELTEGFAAAYPQWVRRVPGGVARSTAQPPGSVAVVIGGGSGHYPAFAGLVGQGLAHAAAMGNIFASPSAQQIVSVAKAAHRGGGVIFSFGNYAGDILNFRQAQERLAAEGIESVLLPVTDDVSSAPLEEMEKRRGVAGDLAVFKIAGAASDAGASLADTAKVAARANFRTRSFGIAFSGCTLPGATDPLFTVPEGRMAVGMGIHGEPGIGEEDLPTADAAAELLVSRLLDEVPEGCGPASGARVGVILNGLGSVKTEELFVVYRRVGQLLANAGITIIEPEIGEFATSFQMAGISLTLLWLDEELEALWKAPASAPGYRKGAVAAPEGEEQDTAATEPAAASTAVETAGPASRETASVIVGLLDTVRQIVDTHLQHLGDLDSIAGDGDHGIGMERGSTAAAAAAHQVAAAGAGAGDTLAAAADAWADKAGGTSGALWGLILHELAAGIGNQKAPTPDGIAGGLRHAGAKVMAFGKAAPGDKTMVDVLVPFGDAFTSAVRDGAGLRLAWSSAAKVATEAADATADMVPRMGRARPLAEKSMGHPDPGAVSMSLIINAVGERLQNLDITKQNTHAQETNSQ